MEQEIARQRTNLTQLAEENKGMQLMQDFHIGQIAELKQIIQTKDEELKELKKATAYRDTMTKELIDAQDSARRAEDEKNFKLYELASVRRSQELLDADLNKQIFKLKEEIENMKDNERHF